MFYILNVAIDQKRFPKIMTTDSNGSFHCPVNGTWSCGKAPFFLERSTKRNRKGFKEALPYCFPHNRMAMGSGATSGNVKILWPGCWVDQNQRPVNTPILLG